jgi:hypothetical protein
VFVYPFEYITPMEGLGTQFHEQSLDRLAVEIQEIDLWCLVTQERCYAVQMDWKKYTK